MSAVIRSAEVTCDDCGKTLRRMALSHNRPGKVAERRILRALAAYAQRRGWQIEGPAPMAGDLCPRCRVYADMARGLEAS